MTEPPGRIHSEHPFATPAELREPARQFRGRLPAPVTIWTSGAAGAWAGLTVSSLLVAEGEPPVIVGLVGDATDLWEAIEQTGTFVVHGLEAHHRELAERFAGRRPSPGGLFSGLQIEETDWGPAVDGLVTRSFCRLAEKSSAGYHLLVTGTVERVDLHELIDPLVYHRGVYRHLGA